MDVDDNLLRDVIAAARKVAAAVAALPPLLNRK